MYLPFKIFLDISHTHFAKTSEKYIWKALHAIWVHHKKTDSPEKKDIPGTNTVKARREETMLEL